MKKLGFVLFIIADFILFAIARIIFDTQYLQFFNFINTFDCG